MPEVKEPKCTIEMERCDRCFPEWEIREWGKIRPGLHVPCFCVESDRFKFCLCEQHLMLVLEEMEKMMDEYELGLERLREYQGELQRDAELGHLMADLPDTQDLKMTGL